MKVRFSLQAFKRHVRQTLTLAPAALTIGGPMPIRAQPTQFPTAIEAPALMAAEVIGKTARAYLTSSTERIGAIDLPFADAIDALKLVEHGDFRIQVPLKSGERLNGFRIRPGTVLDVSLQVCDGKVDMDHMHLRFSPALDGPLWIDVQGIVLTASGNASVQVRGMPRAETRSRGTQSLDQLARQLLELTGRQKMDVRVLGKKIISVPAPDLDKVMMTINADELLNGSNLGGLRVTARDMTFRAGEVALGDRGTLRLGAGGRVNMDGTAERMELRGALDVNKLSWHADGVQMDSISTRGTIALDYRNPADGPPTLSGQVQGQFGSGPLQVQHSRGTLQIDRASVAEGTVRFDGFEPVAQTPGGLPARPQRLDVKLPGIEAELRSAAGGLQTPMGGGQFQLGNSSFDGSVSIDSTGAVLRGEGAVQAVVRDVRVAHGGASAAIGQAQVEARGEATVRAEAGLFMQRGTAAEQAPMAQVMPQVSVTASGELGFSARDIELQAPGAEARTASAEGRAGGAVSLDTRHWGEVDGSNVSGRVILGQGRVVIGDQLDLQLLPGTSLEGAISSLAVRGTGLTAKVSSGAVSAGFSGGRVTMPTGEQLQLGRGQLVMRLDQASISSHQAPGATGTLSLEATASAPTVTLPMARAENAGGTVKLDIGRFRIDPDGTFELLGVKVQLAGGADRVAGRMPTLR
jgi:hypothetical protein